MALRRADYASVIESYEPLPAAHSKLVAARSRVSDPNWRIGRRIALGAQPGSTEINVAGNSQSSSILPMLDRHLQGAPESRYVGREVIEVETVENVIGDRSEKFALKMDVQGFEAHVLAGAEAAADNIPVVGTEMALQPLYDGEQSYTELSELLRRMGYTCIGIWPGYADPISGEMLQVDGLFVRLPH